MLECKPAIKIVERKLVPRLSFICQLVEVCKFEGKKL